MRDCMRACMLECYGYICFRATTDRYGSQVLALSQCQRRNIPELWYPYLALNTGMISMAFAIYRCLSRDPTFTCPSKKITCPHRPFLVSQSHTHTDATPAAWLAKIEVHITELPQYIHAQVPSDANMTARINDSSRFSGTSTPHAYLGISEFCD